MKPIMSRGEARAMLPPAPCRRCVTRMRWYMLVHPSRYGEVAKYEGLCTRCALLPDFGSLITEWNKAHPEIRFVDREVARGMWSRDIARETKEEPLDPPDSQWMSAVLASVQVVEAKTATFTLASMRSIAR